MDNMAGQEIFLDLHRVDCILLQPNISKQYTTRRLLIKSFGWNLPFDGIDKRCEGTILHCPWHHSGMKQWIIYFRSNISHGRTNISSVTMYSNSYVFTVRANCLELSNKSLRYIKQKLCQKRRTAAMSKMYIIRIFLQE